MHGGSGVDSGKSVVDTAERGHGPLTALTQQHDFSSVACEMDARDECSASFESWHLTPMLDSECLEGTKVGVAATTSRSLFPKETAEERFIFGRSSGPDIHQHLAKLALHLPLIHHLWGDIQKRHALKVAYDPNYL